MALEISCVSQALREDGLDGWPGIYNQEFGVRTEITMFVGAGATPK